MSDPRLTPDPARITKHEKASVAYPVADLRRAPNGVRDRQVLYGDLVTVLNDAEGWSYVQAAKDGYCGYVVSEMLGPFVTPTHIVNAPATHAYDQASFKSADRLSLSHNSRVEVIAQTDRFAQTQLGFVPLVHLSPVQKTASDPASVARHYLGTPYLWGGNSRWGIDCSGLVQAALLACAIPCPGDSDMQEKLGQEADGTYQRNDLLFWKGHVALVTDAETLIHANASAMATVYEPIKAAIKRISDQGDGPVTAHRRL